MALPQLFFKHLYGFNPSKWGFLGIPRNQDPSVLLKKHFLDSVVLMAVVANPKKEEFLQYAGQIVGYCTVKSGIYKTISIVPDELLNDTSEDPLRWPLGIPIKECYLFKPDFRIRYDSQILNGILGERVRQWRGRLILLNDELNDAQFNDLWTWFDKAKNNADKQEVGKLKDGYDKL